MWEGGCIWYFVDVSFPLGRGVGVWVGKGGYKTNHTEETQNSNAIAEATHGEDDQERTCVQNHMSTLSGVLCRRDMSTFASSFQRTFIPGPSEIAPY